MTLGVRPPPLLPLVSPGASGLGSQLLPQERERLGLHASQIAPADELISGNSLASWRLSASAWVLDRSASEGRLSF